MEKYILDLINQTDLFKGVEEKIFKELIESIGSKLINFKKDEYVAFRGDIINGIYINLEGVLVAEMLRENGNIKKVEELRNGKIIASAFVFGNVNRFPVDLVAKSDIKILFIPKKELTKLLGNSEQILINFVDEISNKAQFLSKNLWESLASKTINQKLSEYILENEKNGIFILQISIKELAEYFNISRPSLSRVMKNFIEDGLLEKLEKGKYRILLRERLEESQ